MRCWWVRVMRKDEGLPAVLWYGKRAGEASTSTGDR